MHQCQNVYVNRDILEFMGIILLNKRGLVRGEVRSWIGKLGGRGAFVLFTKFAPIMSSFSEEDRQAFCIFY